MVMIASLIGTLIILGGLYIFSKPDIVAFKLKNFYLNYPIVRYAGEKQLTSRPIFIKLTGIVIIIVGLSVILAGVCFNK